MDPQPNELEPGAQRILGPPQSRKGAIFAVIALLIAAAAATYVWLNYDGIVQNVVSAGQPATAQPETNQRETVAVEDFQALQKQTADSLKSLSENLIAQKGDIQRLSEQVSVLAAKLDTIQSTASTTGPPQQAVPARPAIPSARKRASAPAPGPVSIGGAPLPPNQTDGH